ncbi:MAG: sigma-70 family RNA polymerase sigma factor [Bacteroidales bacterium]|jgi:RNA polymerase sigma factor (sigma-70 family)|nr:sigma-70 family RNA polymerase sigma factor [Bacteroidales bacterium]
MEISSNLSDKAKYDLVLVERAKNREESAFAELLQRYRDTIFFMLLKKVNNEIDAEDLTIEAFGKAFNNIHQYTPNFAFSTWLFKIANNNCIDFLRKQKKKTYPIDAYIHDDENRQSVDVATTLLDPEERLIKDQKAEMLKDIIRQLKPRYSTLIKLRYYREMSYAEIAEELDIPLGTVKAQLYRSRELLQAMLKPDVKNM